MGTQLFPLKIGEVLNSDCRWIDHMATWLKIKVPVFRLQNLGQILYGIPGRLSLFGRFDQAFPQKVVVLSTFPNVSG